MHKEVDPVETNTAVLDPPDADFKFSAKVMLLSLPSIDDMFRKSCALAEDGQDGDLRDGFVHPTRLINFLVGSKGKSDTMAIGGPWSPSLDGPNPDKDPAVLIKTAIRTCRALTGIDLSRCTLWYRFLELHYRRADAHNKPQAVKVETVVLFLPDVWSCVPTRLEWDGLQHNYNKQLARITNGAPAEAAAGGKEALRDQGADQKAPSLTDTILYTVFCVYVGDLRRELEARGVSPKGLTSQLQARLGKILKSEQDVAEEEEAAAVAAAAAAKAKAEAEEKEKILQAAQEREMDPKAAERKKKEEEEKKRQEERERQARERRYQLPSSPHIIVHPSRSAKSGRFDCTVMSLSLLLDYRAEDTKEHSFEVSLFAELFNEMLMRDFGFRIYRSLVKAPENPKEEEKDRKDSKEKKKEDGKDNDTEKDSEETGEDSSSNSKKKERDRREKVKMVTVDPQLLLAFIYFDQTHCGYIFDRDMEEILHALGLHLSRAQCRRLLQKVLTRDTLAYRKLTDRSEPANGEASSADSAQEMMNSGLAKGNSTLLPEFSTACIPPRVHSDLHYIVNWNGTLVNVKQLLAQLKRSQKARRVTEAKIAAIQSEFNNAENKASKSTTKAAELAQTLKKSQDRLRDAEEELRLAKANCSKFQAALEAVKNVLDPVMEETRSMPRKKEETSETKSDEPSLPAKQESQEEEVKEEAEPKSE
ncbi:hypothetical protein B566_EDAN006173 [Ephemera danica]|nr:hypothetical protein B566_EDAN006173 [Ephemera danica]